MVDLTESNPTRVGLSGAGEAQLSALVAPEAALYEPDPRGVRGAREAVAGYYRERGIAVSPGDVVLTSGTSEAYAHLFRLLADPGQTLLVPSPSYPLFEPLAALEGVRLTPYRVAWDGGWHLDLGSLEAAIRDGARAMIVVQPHHPTGFCLSGDEIAAAERLCEHHGTAIISDEVFGDFPWRQEVEGPSEGAAAARPRTPLGLPSLLGERHVPTFVLSGLSKVCGLPQLKLSWIAVAGPEASRAEALRGLEWIADLFLSVGTPVQCALPGLLAGRHAWQSRVRDRIAANLARLRETTARRPQLDLMAGAGGWVAVLRVPSQQGEEGWALELLRRDVVVHPGHFYDMEGDAHLVVSLIVEPADFDAGLERIEALAGSVADRPATYRS